MRNIVQQKNFFTKTFSHILENFFHDLIYFSRNMKVRVASPKTETQLIHKKNLSIWNI